MLSVVALVLDREARARLADTLRAHARVTYCETGDELITSAAVIQPAAAVLELRGRSGASLLPALRRLRSRCPALPVVVWCALSHSAASDILEAARLGVHALVLRGIDDIGVALRHSLAEAEEHAAAAEALAALEALFPPVAPEAHLAARPIVEYCLRHAADSLTVECLAAALGLHRRTLLHRLGRAKLPAPSALIGWCRLLVAAKLLENRERPVDHVALRLGFASGSALRTMLKRYTGLRPTEVRHGGGLAAVVHAFGERTLARAPEPALEQPRVALAS